MTTARLFVGARQIVTCAGPPRPRIGAELGNAGIVTERALLVRDGLVAAIAPESELRPANPDAEIVDCAGGVLTPGFVDSHTHAIFGRARYEEQELRAAGADYMEIARQGG